MALRLVGWWGIVLWVRLYWEDLEEGSEANTMDTPQRQLTTTWL